MGAQGVECLLWPSSSTQVGVSLPEETLSNKKAPFSLLIVINPLNIVSEVYFSRYGYATLYCSNASVPTV